MMKMLPEKLKGKIYGRLLRRVLVCAVMYAVLYYGLIYRYSLEYYMEHVGGIVTGTLITVFLIVPFLLSGLYGYIRDKSFEGRVLKVVRTRELKPWRGGPNMHEFFTREQCIVVRATVELDNGDVIERIIRRYDMDDMAQSLCQPGDRVRHVKGTSYTQIYGMGKRHDIDCVWCGCYSDVRYKECERCGAPIIPWIVKELPVEDKPQKREHALEKPADVLTEEYTPIYVGPQQTDSSEVHDNINYSQRPTRSADDDEFRIGEVTPTPEFGTYKRRVDPLDFLGLLGVSLAIITVMGYISLIFTRMEELSKNADKWVFAIVAAGLIPLAVSIYYMRSYPSTHYRKSEGFPAWLSQGARFVVPAEIARLIISVVPIAGNVFGSLFSPLSHLWWYLYYMLPSERFEDLEKGIFIGEDYTAYLAVAIPAMLLRIALLMAGYYYFWRKYEKERESMFKERNDRMR